MFDRVAVALLMAALSGPAAAEPQTFTSGEQRVRLLELYTSEGCSSCPPADQFMSELAGDRRLWTDIVPVAFHVDYWDYIGWPDRFASPVFAKRQRQHAQLRRVSNVYTPGFVLGGREWKGFFRGGALPGADAAAVGSLTVAVEGDSVLARFEPPHALGHLELHVALLGFDLQTEVRAGENRGKRLAHDFVVLAYGRAYLDPDAAASGAGYEAPVTIPPASQASARTAIAAWVTPVDDTLPIQAVGGWLR